MYKSRLQEQPHQSAKYTTTLLRSGASLTALTVSYRSSMKCTRALLSFTRGRCEMVLHGMLSHWCFMSLRHLILHQGQPFSRRQNQSVIVKHPLT